MIKRKYNIWEAKQQKGLYVEIMYVNKKTKIATVRVKGQHKGVKLPLKTLYKICEPVPKIKRELIQ